MIPLRECATSLLALETPRRLSEGEGGDTHENCDDDQKLQFEKLGRQSVPAAKQALTQR